MREYLVGISPDITIKSKGTRLRFQRRLAANLRDALATSGVAGEIEDRWSRLVVSVPESEAAADRITSVFGVHSVSEIEARVPASLDEIVRAGEECFGERVRDRAFAVRTKRDGTVPFRSRDVEVRLGAALDRYGHVNLSHPDITVRVEVRGDEAFLFANRRAGPCGLPIGVEGRAVSLLSGGFDSPVAAWMMLRRGIGLDYVFCNLGGEAYERSVLGVVKVLADLWSYGDRPTLHVVDFAEPVAEMERTVPRRYWQVTLKRLMYRAAGAVAQATRGRCQAIVTGESVGQVSSQTLANLRAIEDVSPLPLLRPLLGMDKVEIIKRAEQVGTAVLSARIREYCALDVRRPVTDATPASARAAEETMDLHVLTRAVANRKELDLRALEDADLVAPYLFTSEIADGSVVIDCRSPAHYAQWHYRGAERWDPPALAARFQTLDKARRYVLYCSFGVQSAHVAELMQEAGYEAYSFKGGGPALRHS